MTFDRNVSHLLGTDLGRDLESALLDAMWEPRIPVPGWVLRETHMTTHRRCLRTLRDMGRDGELSVRGELWLKRMAFAALVDARMEVGE